MWKMKCPVWREPGTEKHLNTRLTRTQDFPVGLSGIVLMYYQILKSNKIGQDVLQALPQKISRLSLGTDDYFLGLEFFLFFFFRLCMTSFFLVGKSLLKNFLQKLLPAKRNTCTAKRLKKNRARRAVLMCRYFFGIAQTPLPFIIYGWISEINTIRKLIIIDWF